MRKKISTARRLIQQSLAESIRIDRDQQQVMLPGKVPGRGFVHLRLCRKVEVTILDIYGRASKNPDPFSFSPECFRADFVDDMHKT